MFDLVFSNPSLQNTFSRATNDRNEIGGWLLCSYWEPTTWPVPFKWREVKKSLEISHGLLFIESFIMVPNQSKNPMGEWSAWDFEKARDLVQETARVYRRSAIHFHSHPNGEHEPSQADIAFAAACCQFHRGYSKFCIVTHAPFRLWLYTLEWGNYAQPDKGQLQANEFISWRRKEMRKFRNEKN